MFEKDLHIAYLLDFYGDILPEKIRRVMLSYYDEDLSLSEIATGEGISRQGVRHFIKRGEELLHAWEDSLGLASHYTELSATAEQLQDLAQKELSFNDPRTQELCQVALNCVKLMRNL